MKWRSPSINPIIIPHKKKENQTIPETKLQGKHFHAAPASPQDAFWVASNLREADRLELERWYEEPPLTVIRESLKSSAMAWAAYRPDGMPVSIWGVAVVPGGGVGIPWMVGTDFIQESYRDFLFFSKHYDAIMSRYFMLLTNMVDAEYAGAHRWLEWLGYSKGKHVTSTKGYDFIVMHKDTSDVR